MQLSREYLLWLFDYDKENGKLYWKNHWCANRRPALVGNLVGVKENTGYLSIGINYKRYYVHRIIWKIETGTFPDDFIDHINGDKKDNRFSNMRLVNNRKNQQNQYSHREGRLVGCYFHIRRQRWIAQIKLPGMKNQKYLGLFDTELEAHRRYMQELKARGLA